jgi:hypothetical protein
MSAPGRLRLFGPSDPATSVPDIHTGTLPATLNVACRKCGRRRRLYAARLLREHGPDKPMLDLIRAFEGECPRLRSTDIYDCCDSNCLSLSELFAGGTAEAQHAEGRYHR